LTPGFPRFKSVTPGFLRFKSVTPGFPRFKSLTPGFRLALGRPKDAEGSCHEELPHNFVLCACGVLYSRI